MGKMVLDDFIKYAKEQFNCDIIVKPCDKPDTFASVFGASFLNDKNYMEIVDGFERELNYENVSIDVEFTIDDGINVVYMDNVGLAA